MARRLRALDQVERKQRVHLFFRNHLALLHNGCPARNVNGLHLRGGLFLRARGLYVVDHVRRQQVGVVNHFAKCLEPDGKRRNLEFLIDGCQNLIALVFGNTRAQLRFQCFHHELLQFVDLRRIRVQQRISKRGVRYFDRQVHEHAQQFARGNHVLPATVVVVRIRFPIDAGLGWRGGRANIRCRVSKAL